MFFTNEADTILLTIRYGTKVKYLRYVRKIPKKTQNQKQKKKTKTKQNKTKQKPWWYKAQKQETQLKAH